MISDFHLHSKVGNLKPFTFVPLLVEKGEQVNQLLNLKRLFGLVTRVESFVKGRFSQCYRCQIFWHTSDNCHTEPT